MEKPKEPKKEDRKAADTNNLDKKKKKRKRIIKQTGIKPNLSGKEDKATKNEPEKVEISPEDIQRRIKETKQRLEPTGKTKAAKRRIT